MTARETSGASDPTPPTSPSQRWMVAGIVLLAFGIRCLPYSDVFVSGRVFFVDPDAYYHMRRIMHGIARGPFRLGFDHYLNYPEGAKAIWPPFMDGLIATLLRLFHTPGNEVAIERIVVWIPPLLGASTVFVIYCLAARHFGRRVAIVAALILSVLSGHFWYSQISFVDHHAAISLIATLLLAGTMTLLRGPAEESPPFFFRSRGAQVGCVCVLSLLVWPGAILYVALVEAGLFVRLCAVRSDASARRWLDAALILNLVAFVLVLPFSAFNDWPQWGPYSAVVLSHFQPWFFCAGAALAILCRIAWSGQGVERGFAARLLQVSFIALAVLAASGALIPELRATYVEAWEWLGRSESFQAMVGESRPIFDLHGEFTTRIVELRLSRFFYAVPLALAVLAVQTKRRGGEPEIVFYIAWTMVLMGMTLLQKRFFNTFSVALALLFGWACVTAWERVSGRLGETRASRVVGWGLVSVAAFWLLLPGFAAYRLPASSLVSVLRGGRPIYSARMVMNLSRQHMGEWLRENTPPTSGLYDVAGRPEYGVLARWGEGHFLKYVAERPTVVGNFGDDLGREHFERARSIYSAEPDVAAAILEALRVKYIVTRTRYEGRPLARRLHVEDGRGLGRYRLVYEAPAGISRAMAPYKIFEFVEGARVTGIAKPGETVDASLDLTTNLGRSFRFETRSPADEAGRYELRLPYSNTGLTGSTRSSSLYRLTVGARVATLSIGEEDVVAGREVAGPSFR